MKNLVNSSFKNYFLIDNKGFVYESAHFGSKKDAIKWANSLKKYTLFDNNMVKIPLFEI